MSLHTINSAALGATARDLAVVFPLRCLVPAVALAVVGILCRRLLKKSHPSVYGEDGLKLRDVTVASVLAGVGVGACSMTVCISALSRARLGRGRHANAKGPRSPSTSLSYLLRQFAVVS